MDIAYLLTSLYPSDTLCRMEAKSITYHVRMTEEQRRKLERIAEILRRTDGDTVRILIEDKYSELAGVQAEQVPA